MPDLPERLVAALAGRYTIERELGRGGMAVVYLAHDRKHDRKVVQPGVAESVKAERFLREIQVAAKLTHPHILPLYDSGQVDGVLYYVMPYVEGESLRDRLNREKQLAVDDALRITRDVASALDEAHHHGVVHRDIKPENILLTRTGEALVADFGIARALTAAGSGTVTEAGLAVGTPAYMSPEQASGGAEVDGRSDIYSLGCVLYEMLAGHPPFAGETAQEILARHTLDSVPSLRAARPGVPRAVERAVAKALAKVPADRFATAAQFAGALVGPRRRWPVYAAVGLVALVGGAILAQRLFRAPVAQSVAVLPFVNLSGDTTQEYFSDGVTEELINALTHIQNLRVPARTSSFAFKGKNVDIRDIGRQLNVATVLEGSIRRLGNRLRVTAQLIKVADGYHLWSETYDRELRDVFAVQEDISRTIVSALRVTLAPGESTALAPRHSENLEAYDLYLRGRYFFSRRTRDGVLKAIDYFTRAIARDSAYASVYSGLADGYVIAGQYDYLAFREAYPKAEAAALKAIQLDDGLAEPHVSLGRVRANVHWDLPGAEREYRRAIQLNPKNAQAHSWYGLALSTLRRCDEAIRETTIAVELEPLEPAYHLNLGNALSCARRYDEAIAQYAKTIEMVPDWGAPHRNLGLTYLAKGQFDAAIAEFETLSKLTHRGGESLGYLGYASARVGRTAGALKLRRELVERRSKGARASYPLAVLSLGLGENDRALGFLNAAVEAREIAISSPRLAIWDPVRSDPRFVALLEKMGLEP